jgi:hypothetical protein
MPPGRLRFFGSPGNFAAISPQTVDVTDVFRAHPDHQTR